jgi:hypothetical protein
MSRTGSNYVFPSRLSVTQLCIVIPRQVLGFQAKILGFHAKARNGASFIPLPQELSAAALAHAARNMDWQSTTLRGPRLSLCTVQSR